MRFRVLTLNLEQDHKRWNARQPLISAEIAALKPDVIAFNEVSVPLQTAKTLRDAATEMTGVEVQSGSANPRQRPVEGRRRSLADPLPGRRNRQFRLPDARHRGAGRPDSRRRRAGRCLCDPSLHVARRRFPAAFPGAAIAGMDRYARGCFGVDRVRRLQREPRRAFRGPDGDPLSSRPRPLPPPSPRSPTATARYRIPTGRAWTAASITSGCPASIGVLASEVCFNRPSPDDPSLWPSDHAGVWADLQI